MAGNTVADLNERLTSLTNELTILTSSIKKYLTSENKDQSLKKDIREFNEQADTYDRKFEEEESRLQAYGGKTRKQTLQEFIILFLFVAYGIMSVAFILYANRLGITSRVVAIMVFIFLVLTAILVTYA
jgi:lipopolysaccharide export LptBFGC system permease protein LptF